MQVITELSILPLRNNINILDDCSGAPYVWFAYYHDEWNEAPIWLSDNNSFVCVIMMIMIGKAATTTLPGNFIISKLITLKRGIDVIVMIGLCCVMTNTPVSAILLLYIYIIVLAQLYVIHYATLNLTNEGLLCYHTTRILAGSKILLFPPPYPRQPEGPVCLLVPPDTGSIPGRSRGHA